MRKLGIWATLLSVIAFIGGLPLPHVLAADTVARLTPATQTVSVGETTTVTLRVEDVESLYGHQAEIAFDPAVLEVVDADGATAGVQVALGSWLQPDFVLQNSADNVLGTIGCVLSQLSPRPAVSGSGALLTITFRGKAAGVSPITFSELTLAHENGTALPASLQDAQVEVSQGTPSSTPTPTTTPIPTPPPSGTVLTLRTTDLSGQAIVEVWVENVVDFYSVEFSLAFDRAIVRGLSVVPGRAFTDYPSQCVVLESSIAGGVVQFAGTMVCIAQTGDLHVATITFEDVACGTSPLTWLATQLSDSGANAIAHTAQDGSLTPYPCPAKVNGRALLEGRTNHGGIAVSLAGGMSQGASTGSDGQYAFTDVPADVYDLVISHDLYLATEFRSCSVQAGQTVLMPDVTLVGGDLDGNKVINIVDLVLASAQFNSASPAADLNASGLVDIFDVVLIGVNFGKVGPIVATCP